MQTLASGGATVVERATDAPQVSPSPIRDTLLGASFGFVIALLICGAREAFNTRIRSESDVEDALSKPVLDDPDAAEAGGNRRNRTARVPLGRYLCAPRGESHADA